MRASDLRRNVYTFLAICTGMRLNLLRSLRGRGRISLGHSSRRSYGLLERLSGSLVCELGRHVHRLEMRVGRFGRGKVIGEVRLGVRKRFVGGSSGTIQLTTS